MRSNQLSYASKWNRLNYSRFFINVKPLLPIFPFSSSFDKGAFVCYNNTITKREVSP